MIQEVNKQIHFQSYVPVKGRKKDTDAPPTATVNKRLGKITFGSRTLAKLKMHDKFIAFYYEPTKKIVGWQIKDRLEHGELAGKHSSWKLVKTYGRGLGFYSVQIKGILDTMVGLGKDIYKNLEVKRYVEKEGILERGSVYYFVEVKEKEV